MSKTKQTAIFLVVAFVIVLGITLIAKESGAPANPTTSAPSETINPNGSNTGTTGKAYTLAEVATHSNSASCWTVVGTNVYDLTTWINSHPGGPEAILGICGKNGTAAFESQHGGQRRPEAELANFLIGAYKQ